MANSAPVVMDLPASESPQPQERASIPAPASGSKRAKISPEGRRWLREGMAQLGLGRDRGNSLADWLDKQKEVEVTFVGRVPDPPLVVHSSPDVVPMPDRRALPEGDAPE